MRKTRCSSYRYHYHFHIIDFEVLFLRFSYVGIFGTCCGILMQREDVILEWIFLPRKPNKKLKTYIEKISDLIHKACGQFLRSFIGVLRKSLKSILLDIRIATPACFLSPFDWKAFSQPVTLSS
ncbi:hypothetical protein STEG23_002694 [Scotinomys teguina]